jgi:hypothetical protein
MTEKKRLWSRFQSLAGYWGGSRGVHAFHRRSSDGNQAFLCGSWGAGVQTAGVLADHGHLGHGRWFRAAQPHAKAIWAMPDPRHSRAALNCIMDSGFCNQTARQPASRRGFKYFVAAQSPSKDSKGALGWGSTSAGTTRERSTTCTSRSGPPAAHDRGASAPRIATNVKTCDATAPVLARPPEPPPPGPMAQPPGPTPPKVLGSVHPRQARKSPARIMKHSRNL